MASFTLNKEQKKKAVSEIQSFFKSERDEEIGELQAMLLMEFFVENLGNVIYNKGMDDAKRYMEEKLDDMYEMYQFDP